MADEVFHAINHEIGPIALREGLHTANIGTCARLCHGETVNPLPPTRRIKICLPLITDTGLKHVRRPVNQVIQRHAGAPQGPVQHTHGQRIQTAAAHVFGHIGGVKSHLERLLDDLIAKLSANFVRLFDLFLIGVELFFDETERRFDNQLLFFGDTKIHRLTSPLLNVDAEVPRPRLRDISTKLP